MQSDDDDDDTFVTIGSACDVPEENEPLKKPSKVQDQIAVDKQGRRRFHGAFTGGFSAGYFNTVGSKEGWAPSTFVSSRADRKKDEVQTFRPEDFMDEEDFADHGIAPRKLKTTADFESTDKELERRKRLLQKDVNEGEIRSAIPGGIPVDDLILPSKLSIGIKLLKKMGWKPGQGIGEKVDALGEKFDSTLDTKKVYGCARPPAAGDLESMDMKTFTSLLAPKDIQPLQFSPKDNLHGIGYSGIDPTTAMFGGLTESRKAFKPTGKEKRGIKGQAFGVGVFEEEDDDVYSNDNLSNYDLTMGDEKKADANYGWSGPFRPTVNKGCLRGFVNSSQVVTAPKCPLPFKLPSGYIPKHVFPEDLNKQDINSKSEQRAKLSSKDRSLLLGEATKTLKDVNPWTLKWDHKPTEEKADEANKENNKDKTKTKTSRFSTRWDKEIHQERPKQVENDASKDGTSSTSEPSNAPMYDKHTGAFKPFAKNPLKQVRYDEFLAARREQRSPNFVHDSSITEWGRERELEEFARAALLYRPLSSAIATRFTRATTVTANVDQRDTGQNSNTDEDKPSDKKAAEMGMYGQLTRTILEWHPDRLLCKRFNIPHPYPSSKIKGVPSRVKKSSNFFSDSPFENSLAMIEDSKKQKDEEDEDFGDLLKKKQKLKNKGKINIGPLSHLNKTEASKNEGLTIPDSTSYEPLKRQEEGTSKPSIDIFKAIFDNSDSESDDSSNDEEDNDSNKDMNDPVASENTPSPTVNIAQSIAISGTQLSSVASVTQPLVANVSGTIASDSVNSKIGARGKDDDAHPLPLAFLNNSSRTDVSVAKTEVKCDTPSKDHDTDSKREARSTVEEQHTVPQHSSTSHRQERNDKKRIERDSVSDDSGWEEHNKKNKKTKKHKKEKKSKKSKKKRYSSEDEEVCNEEKISKHKHKKHKKHRTAKKKAASSSSSDEETLIPSNTELLEKLKKYSKSVKRPSAADFM